MKDELSAARTVYRSYYAHVSLSLAIWVGAELATAATRYALGCLVGRAMKGHPCVSGPHSFVRAMAVDFLARRAQMISEAEAADMSASFFHLDENEATSLCSAMAFVYEVAQAAEVGPTARLTIEDLVQTFDPFRETFVDGFRNRAETSLVAGVLHRAESAMDDPESPAADWMTLAAQYAVGELHRHLGWAQEPTRQEAEDDGEQQTEVRDRRVPDPEGSDDQVEGIGAHRRFVFGQSPRPDTHQPDPDDN